MRLTKKNVGMMCETTIGSTGRIVSIERHPVLPRPQVRIDIGFTFLADFAWVVRVWHPEARDA